MQRDEIGTDFLHKPGQLPRQPFIRKPPQGSRSGFLLVGLIEHRRCEISREETFEIKSSEMPGNTSNFNNHHEVAYRFGLDSYIFNANICIEQKLVVGL